MTRLLALAGASAVLLASLGARADVMQDPCDGLVAGDPCTTVDMKAGHCADSMGTLDCVEDTGAGGGGGAGGGTGATGGGATTGGGQAATGGSATTGGDETSDDGGCTMTHGPGRGASAFAGLAAIALGMYVSRRRRDRSRA